MQYKQPHIIMQQTFQDAHQSPNWQKFLYDQYKCLPSDLIYVFCTTKKNTSSTSREADLVSQSLNLLFQHFFKQKTLASPAVDIHLERVRCSLAILPSQVKPLYARVFALLRRKDLLLSFTLLAETFETKNDFCSLENLTNESEWKELHAELEDGTIVVEYLESIFSKVCATAVTNLGFEESKVRAQSFVKKVSNPEVGGAQSSPFAPDIIAGYEADSAVAKYHQQRSSTTVSLYAPSHATNIFLQQSYAFFNLSQTPADHPHVPNLESQAPGPQIQLGNEHQSVNDTLRQIEQLGQQMQMIQLLIHASQLQEEQPIIHIPMPSEQSNPAQQEADSQPQNSTNQQQTPTNPEAADSQSQLSTDPHQPPNPPNPESQQFSGPKL